eukprot:TRINITY_DN9135_c0_g1_i2.p1 TRINITY_DN9135_c0_g1~~TRINITY_DN9135_c0_g1_i2.p1  ORF type:complete len:999 (+),score=344.71 TRINITY_DN9135_c0_g1_i2:353-2998(+)
MNHIVNANILSMVYPIAAFCYALMERPRPTKQFWRLMLVYTNTLIVAKFIFQLQIFCVCYTPRLYYWWYEPQCQAAADSTCDPSYEADTVINGNLPSFWGIEKLGGVFLLSIFWDVVVLVLCLVHRYMMKKSGYWQFFYELKLEKRIEYAAELQREKQRKAEEKRLKKAEKKRLKEEKRLREQGKPIPPHVLPKDPHSPKTTVRRRRSTGINLEVDAQHHAEDQPPRAPLPASTSVGGVDRVDDDSVLSYPRTHTNKSVATRSVRSIASKKDTFVRRILRWIFRSMSDIPVDIKFYYHSLLNKKHSYNDYYVELFLVETIVFFFLLFFQSAFTAYPNTQWTLFLLESRIPESFFYILLSQFVLILADRVVYLFRSVLAKIVLQYVTIAAYHYLLFIYLPNSNQKPFNHQFSLVAFYLLKCVYWWLSDLQIRSGYPLYVQQRALTGSPYSYPRYLIFMVYYSIPFVYELRTLLDWTIHDTSLTFFHWLKLEDIYSNAFMVKCKREKEATENLHAKQSFVVKIGMGLSLFLGLVILLWFPLFLLSSANPTNKPNYVVSATIEIGLPGWAPFYHLQAEQSEKPVSEALFTDLLNEFSNILPDDRPNTQQISLPRYSDVIYRPTPPSVRSLQNTLYNASLASKSTIDLEFRYTFQRMGPDDNKVVGGKYLRALSPEEAGQFHHVLTSNGTAGSVFLDEAYPSLYRIPLTGAITIPKEQQYLPMSLVLNRTLTEEVVVSAEVVWESTEATEVVNSYTEYWTALTNTTIYPWAVGYGPDLITVSSEMPTGITASLASSGIIGLYVGVVLAVGQFLRLYVADIQMKVIYEDMPDPIDILTLCEDIFNVRQDGDYYLERDLYQELIELYRSPENLISITKRKTPSDVWK